MKTLKSVLALAHPGFQLMRTYAVVIFERLVYPGVGRQFLYVIIGGDLGVTFPPQHRGAQLFDTGELMHQMVAHPAKGHAGRLPATLCHRAYRV